MSIKIGNKEIGIDHPPFIIAEMSGNHNQSLSRALEIVEAAAKSGVDALKLQTYTADTITLDIKGGSFEINDKNSLWKGQNLHNLYSKAYTPWEWHKEIFERSKELGLICFSSPFDESAVDFLMDLDVPAFKIASFENNHLPLIEYVAKTGKPLIISTGMAKLSELDEAVTCAKEAGCKDLILLKCTSTYPAKSINSNLKTIPHLENLFNCQVGLSDHTHGIGAAVASIALGATVIEKHFTLSRAEGGVDSAFSLEPKEMEELVKETKTAWEALGTIKYGPTKDEKKSTIFKRSIYTSTDILKGEVFSKNNIKIVRPGDGLEPKYIKYILGKKASTNLLRGTPISFDLII